MRTGREITLLARRENTTISARSFSVEQKFSAHTNLESGGDYSI